MSFCQIATTYFAGFTKKYKAVPVLIALVFLLLILSATGNKTFIQTLSIQRNTANEWCRERNWNDQMIQKEYIWKSFQGTEHPNNIAAWIAEKFSVNVTVVFWLKGRKNRLTQ